MTIEDIENAYEIVNSIRGLEDGIKAVSENRGSCYNLISVPGHLPDPLYSEGKKVGEEIKIPEISQRRIMTAFLDALRKEHEVLTKTLNNILA